MRSGGRGGAAAIGAGRERQLQVGHRAGTAAEYPPDAVEFGWWRMSPRHKERRRQPAPNDLLRQARLRFLSPSGSGRVLSRQELADAVRELLITRTDQEFSGVDGHYVGVLERGEIRWPGAHYRQAFREAFRAVLRRAAMRSWGSTSFGAAGPTLRRWRRRICCRR